jgi:mono/diheme cytochrome c family protein
MRYFLALYVFALVATVAILGMPDSKSRKPPLEIFPDMDHQAKYQPQLANDFFKADRRNDRPVPEGTVAFSTKGNLEWPKTQPHDAYREDDYLATGNGPDGKPGTGMPKGLTLDDAFLSKGQEKFNIYCSVCHGPAGDSNGITKKYKMGGVPTYHDEAHRNMPDGQIYQTIRYGVRTMGPYGSKLSIEDRWAIVAWVRVLQHAQNTSAADVPADQLPKLK